MHTYGWQRAFWLIGYDNPPLLTDPLFCCVTEALGIAWPMVAKSIQQVPTRIFQSQHLFCWLPWNYNSIAPRDTGGGGGADAGWPEPLVIKQCWQCSASGQVPNIQDRWLLVTETFLRTVALDYPAFQVSQGDSVFKSKPTKNKNCPCQLTSLHRHVKKSGKQGQAETKYQT